MADPSDPETLDFLIRYFDSWAREVRRAINKALEKVLDDIKSEPDNGTK